MIPHLRLIIGVHPSFPALEKREFPKVRDLPRIRIPGFSERLNLVTAFR